MRPIILNGHERPITRITYNYDGDLIFTAAKNQSVCVWYSANGERLGTYDQHDGAVWWLDVDWTSTMLLTASADWSCKLWDVQTGNRFIMINILGLQANALALTLPIILSAHAVSHFVET
uniref:Serine-threonine kinase receptor-associated protein n=1 Tax=Schistosoma japonicum TaxID=6182 RepID=Q5DFQ3_SCHJA|nr:SJCHGC02832 protein [Schistosoma japonicum]